MSDIDIKCRVTTPGGWLDLMSDPYKLTADAFSEEALQWRRQEVKNTFVDGSWLVSATRENITTNVDIWARCATSKDLAFAIERLKEAFSQINYGLEFTVEGVTYYYRCYAADFSVQTSREFRASRMAKFAAQVPRHPIYEVKAA